MLCGHWLCPDAVVIIHGGQIVVHQRVAVDEFYSGGGRISISQVSVQRPVGAIHKNRTYPFAATEAGIGHGFPERVAGIALLDFSREHRFNAALAALKKVRQLGRRVHRIDSAFVFDVKSLGFATLIQQNLDLLFRFLQCRLAFAGQFDALYKSLHGIL